MAKSPSEAIRSAMPEIQSRLKAELGRALKSGHSVSAIEGDHVTVKQAGKRTKRIPLETETQDRPIRRAA